MPESLQNYLRTLPLEEARALYQWLCDRENYDRTMLTLLRHIERRQEGERVTRVCIEGKV